MPGTRWTRRSHLGATVLGAVLFLGQACRKGDTTSEAHEPSHSAAPVHAESTATLPTPPPTGIDGPPSGATASANVVPSSAPTASQTPQQVSPHEAAACPSDMLLVEGSYCPAVIQNCLEHTKEYDRDQERRAERTANGEALAMSRVSERCLRYESPTRCVSPKRTAMRFCIDRYEWPNRAGERPDFAVTWLEAESRCAAVGKRLCDTDEFTFACEGEEMRPYAYGFERDASLCNIDRPYVQPTKKATPHEACMKKASCRAELEALDQRVPSGSMPGCASPFGVMDLNGNVNEWVSRPGQLEPWRSGLKGGWWGPARSRCRPTVTAHNEIYAGYEVGFRCCSAAKP